MQLSASQIVVVVLVAVAIALVALILAVFVPRYRRLAALGRREALDPSGARAALAKVRAEIGAAEIIALALLLGSIVGLAHLGLEIWRTFGSERVGQTETLDERLLSRLPDAERQQQWHSEIVEEIRRIAGSKPADDGLQARLAELKAQVDKQELAISALTLQRHDINAEQKVEVSSAIPTVIQGLALVVILGLTAFSWFTLKILHVTNSISTQTYSRLQTAALSVGTLASIGSVALLKDVTIVKSLDALIKVNVSLPTQEKSTKPPPDPPPPEGPKPEQPPQVVHLYPRLDCGKGKAQRIESFAVGQHTLEGNADAKLTDVIRELKKIPPDRLVGFVLIGSADKRRLRPDLARTYGSNDGLAQARVGVVQERLKTAFTDNPPSFLPLHAGPSRIGSEVPALDLAFDRAVQICVLWTPTPERPGALDRAIVRP